MLRAAAAEVDLVLPQPVLLPAAAALTLFRRGLLAMVMMITVTEQIRTEASRRLHGKAPLHFQACQVCSHSPRILTPYCWICNNHHNCPQYQLQIPITSQTRG